MNWTARAAAVLSCFVFLQCTSGPDAEDEASVDEDVEALSASDIRAEALKVTNSLKTVKAADAPTFKSFVRDRLALQRAGKALFWDQQLGSDGQACASCHMHAGADNRSRNQVDPGLLAGDSLFSASASGTGDLGPNHLLLESDFPLHRLQDVND